MPGPPYLSLVLACYNEEEILAESFRTIRETLDWQKSRPPDKQKLRSGLTPEREAELLAKLPQA